jgi:hypothetical protein
MRDDNARSAAKIRAELFVVFFSDDEHSNNGMVEEMRFSTHESMQLYINF